MTCMPDSCTLVSAFHTSFSLHFKGGSRHAALIDTMHRGDTLAELVKPAGRMRQMLELYRRSQTPPSA